MVVPFTTSDSTTIPAVRKTILSLFTSSMAYTPVGPQDKTMQEKGPCLVTPCHVVPFSERTALDGVGGAYLGNIAEKEEGGRDVGTDGERETPPLMYIPECYSPVPLYTRGASSVVGGLILLSQGGSCHLNDYCADSRPNNQTLWVGTGTVLPEQGCPRTTRSKLSKQWQQQPPSLRSSRRRAGFE